MHAVDGSARNCFRRRAANLAIASAFGVIATAPMAAIIDSGPVSIAVPQTTAGIYLNLVTGVNNIAPASVPGWDFNPWGNSSLNLWGNAAVANASAIVVTAASTAAALVQGDVVGPGSTYVATANTTGTAFRNTGTEYVGIRFTNEVTAAINYGYVEIHTTSPNGTPVLITRYVYENTGAAITIPGPPPIAVTAASRKVHGAAGTFDLPLTLNTTIAIDTNPVTEPRQSSTLILVFTFNKPIAYSQLVFPEGAIGSGSGALTGNDVVWTLNGVPDQQYLTAKMTNFTAVDGGIGADVSVRVGLLTGDVNQSRVVSVGDLGLVNAQLSQPVTAVNYLKDVNATGTLTVADKGITNANLTHALPAP
jgi:hypothetical protein